MSRVNWLDWDCQPDRLPNALVAAVDCAAQRRAIISENMTHNREFLADRKALVYTANSVLPKHQDTRRIGFSKFLRTSTVRRRITQRRIAPVRKRFSRRQSLVSRSNHRNRSLTSREREVLDWLARGKSNAEIGEILGISAATVGKHLEHIYPKLGVENRTAAASFAAEFSRKEATEKRLVHR